MGWVQRPITHHPSPSHLLVSINLITSCFTSKSHIYILRKPYQSLERLRLWGHQEGENNVDLGV